MKVKKEKIAVIGLVLLIGAGCARKGPKEDSPQSVAVPVAVAQVATGNIEETLEVTGTMRAAHDVAISSKIMGKVARVQVKEGQAVGEGQVLVSLEDKELRAQVKQANAGLETARARLEQARHGLGIQTEASSAGVVQGQAALEAATARLAQAEASKVLTAETVSAQVESARAQLAAAQANLDKVKAGAREQEKAEADSAVVQAQSALDNAQANLNRMKNLLSAGAATQQQLDAAQLQYDVAKSNYDMAVERRNLVYEGARSEDVRLAETQVEQAKAGVAVAEANVRQNELRERELEAARVAVKEAESALALAKASTAKTQISEEDIRLAQAGVAQAEAGLTLAESQLDDSRIKSPVRGFVARRMVEKWETVAPGVPLLRIVARGTVEFRAKVSEVEVRKVAVGRGVRVRADALPGEVFEGKVAEVLPAAEAATRTFEIRVVVPNPRDDLKEGMFARGEILMARKEGVVLLRKDAVIRDDNGVLHVFVVQGEQAKKTDVVTGLEAVNTYEVIAGLSAGEKVVVAGQNALRDGDTVTIQTAGGGES